MFVFRIENAYGKGPYQYDECFEDVRFKHDKMSIKDRHPLPIEDFKNLDRLCNLVKSDQCVYFAFQSFEKLCEWFDLDAINSLKTVNQYFEHLDFAVSIYEVKDRFVECGNKQAAFIKMFATLQHRIPIEFIESYYNDYQMTA